MLRLILPVSSIFFAVFFIFLSKNKNNYQKLVANNDEKFAAQISNYLKIGGIFLLVFASIWLLFLLILK